MQICHVNQLGERNVKHIYVICCNLTETYTLLSCFCHLHTLPNAKFAWHAIQVVGWLTFHNMGSQFLSY
jgi:hypothetical protein